MNRNLGVKFLSTLLIIALLLTFVGCGGGGGAPGKELTKKVSKTRREEEKMKKAKREWQLVARLEVDDGKLLVFDPAYYNPDWVNPDHTYDIALEGPPGEASIYLQRVNLGSGDWRNSAVKIQFFESLETSREKVGEVGVDSATLAIAIGSILPNRWHVGGVCSESSIWIEFLEDRERIAEGRRAAEVLSNAGFRIKQDKDDDWLYRFSDPIDDTGIKRANELLKDSGIRGEVNTFVHHSTALITEQLNTRFVATLDDEANPYLVAFESGLGDGIYDWFALKDGNRTIGFLCELIE